MLSKAIFMVAFVAFMLVVQVISATADVTGYDLDTRDESTPEMDGSIDGDPPQVPTSPKKYNNYAMSCVNSKQTTIDCQSINCECFS